VSEEDAHDDLAHRIITGEKYLDQFVEEPQGYCRVVPAGPGRKNLSLRRRCAMISQIGGDSWSPGNWLPIVQGTCYFGKSSLGSLPANFTVRAYHPKLLSTSWILAKPKSKWIRLDIWNITRSVCILDVKYTRTSCTCIFATT